MNNQRSPKEQLLFNFLLSFAAVWLIFQYFNPQKKTATPPRPAPTLQQAFVGIDPALPLPAPTASASTPSATPKPATAKAPVAAGIYKPSTVKPTSAPTPIIRMLTPATAPAEIAKMQANIKANPNDALAQWSRLREGLIEQYVLQKMAPVEIPGSFFSRSWTGDIYDELINHQGSEDIDAQAIYQKGDMLWRKAGGTPSVEATHEFEKLLQKSRGNNTFNNLTIYVQTPDSPVTAPQFKKQTVIQTLGGPGNTDPNSILHRIDAYYQTTGLYRGVNTVVTLFGSQPAYSYGLTILFFAICTRILMQPLTKKQYDSMKGMQVIAPEMKKIQEKYKGNTDQAAQMKMVKEIQDLQRRHGVSPMLGCGLGMVQIPIFFYVVSPAMRHYEAKMELAGASFLWIHNLARPDIVLLVMYGITMFVSFRISSLPPTDETQRQQQRMMMFMMPMFPFFLLHYPSAFALYWMLFNLTSTILQYRMMKASDPDKRVIKSIIGSSTALFSAPEEEKKDSVPPRPKDGVKNAAKKAKLTMSEGTEAFEQSEALNGTLNGSSNGTQNGSAPQGDAKETAGTGKTTVPRSAKRKKRY